MSYAEFMAMTKRTGRDRRVSVYFPPSEAERRAYQERREESASTGVQEPRYTEIPESTKVETQAGPNVRGRHVAIVVLILTAALIVSL